MSYSKCDKCKRWHFDDARCPRHCYEIEYEEHGIQEEVYADYPICQKCFEEKAIKFCHGCARVLCSKCCPDDDTKHYDLCCDCKDKFYKNILLMMGGR